MSGNGDNVHSHLELRGKTYLPAGTQAALYAPRAGDVLFVYDCTEDESGARYLSYHWRVYPCTHCGEFTTDPLDGPGSANLCLACLDEHIRRASCVHCGAQATEYFVDSFVCAQCLANYYQA